MICDAYIQLQLTDKMDEEIKTCGKPTLRGTRCRVGALPGWNTCRMHLTKEEKAQYTAKKAEEKLAENKDVNPNSKTKPASPYSSSSKKEFINLLERKDAQIEILIQLFKETGINAF